MSIPSMMQNRTLVLSKLMQTAYATILTDVNLQAGKRISPESPFFGMPSTKRWSDMALAMKGEFYSTQVDEIERDLSEQLVLTGDSWLLPWAFAMAMGTSVASQPDSGGSPLAFQHVIKPQDPVANGKNLPVTTIYTEASEMPNMQRRLQSMVVKQVALDVPGKGSPLKVTVDLVGSGQITSGLLASQPSLYTLVPLFSQNLVFKYGPVGATVDISSQIVDGSVKLTFGYGFDDRNARAPSGGLFRSRAWLTEPEITLSFQRFVDTADSSPNDDYFANAIRECIFSVQGPQIAGDGTQFHSFQVDLKSFVPTVVKMGVAGDKTVYQYTVAKDHFLKQGTNDVIVVTAENLETSFLV
jgi:hypothetical protein